MIKRYTKSILIRIEPAMDKGIRRTAKAKKVEVATFVRGAIANAVAKHTK